MNPSTNGSSTTHRDPRLLTTLPEILSCLSEFQSEEAELSNSLSALLKDQEPIVVALERLQALTPQFDEIIVDAQKLKAKVSITAGTAKRVGSRVRSLDDEMGRVREASEHVGQVMDLKVSASFTRGTVPILSLLFSRHWRHYKRPWKAGIGNLQQRTVQRPWESPSVSQQGNSQRSPSYVSTPTMALYTQS